MSQKRLSWAYRNKPDLLVLEILSCLELLLAPELGLHCSIVWMLASAIKHNLRSTMAIVKKIEVV